MGDKKFSDITIEQKLNTISRLRLIANNFDELYELTKFKVTNKNGLGKIGGKNDFIKEAVYDSICKKIEDETGCSFNTFLKDYFEASNFFKIKNLKSLLGNHEDNCLKLIRVTYGNLEIDDIKNNSLKEVLSSVYDSETKEEKINSAILILIALKILPSYNGRTGKDFDIYEDYEKMFNFCENLAKHNTLYEELPAIKGYQIEIKNDEDYAKRYFLYFIFIDILINYKDIAKNYRLYSNNSEIQSNLIVFPDISYWVTANDSYEFWEIRQLSNAQIFRHYAINYEKKVIEYTDIEMTIFNRDDSVCAIASHPNAIMYRFQNKPIPKDSLEGFEVTFSEDADKITFTPITPCHWLKISSIERIENINLPLQAEKFEMRNKYPELEYDYTSRIVACNFHYIYLNRHAGGYYKVPRDLHEDLYLIKYADTAGEVIFLHNDMKFLLFAELNLCYDVTEDSNLKELGIEIVDKIEEDWDEDESNVPEE